MKGLYSLISLAAFLDIAFSDDEIRRNCTKNPPYLPKTVVDTTERLSELRKLMKKENVSAYLIPSTDAHGSEYVRPSDKRRGFISGFSGSAGEAVVTLTKAALWTDGRYFLEADQKLNCEWILQKQGMPGVPSRSQWLKQVLQPDDVVGIDPFLINAKSWESLSKALSAGNLTLKALKNNLVDKIWTDRPTADAKPVIVQPYEYTGKNWWDKVKDVQEAMKKNKATALIVQELDAVAWLLNLRGKEIPYNPVFFAYVVVTTKNTLFFIDNKKLAPQAVQKHLKIDGTCDTKESYCIKIKAYDTIGDELMKLSKEDNALIWLSPADSYALKMDVADDKIFTKVSPIPLMKAKKNKEEMKGMRNANLKDSVALAEFFLYAETQIKNKKKMTELSLEVKMEEFRSKQELYQGLSFASIVGFGKNGAVIHYRASNDTNAEVTDKSTLLVDTGSQYSDGSTDVTRTVHFGTPTADQKSAYTRILMGQIDLASAVFPQGTYGREVDIFAREALYKNGWDYRHGTGHGIGSYLYIHEGPGRIAKVTPGFPLWYETPLYPGFVLSDEPGFYREGDFGIRLETAVVVTVADTKYRFNDIDYYTFDPICYFPLQRKLIDEKLMSDKQIAWLDDYHSKTKKLVGDELKRQKKNKEYDWLVEQTKPIGKPEKPVSSGQSWKSITPVIFVVVVMAILKF